MTDHDTRLNPAPGLHFMTVLDEVLSTALPTDTFDRWVTPDIRLIVPERGGERDYLRLVVRPPAMTGAFNPRDFAYDLLTTILSETTNNDACDVVIRERSAHLDAHPDLDGFHGEVFGTIIIDAVILDELS